jgi:hypothetical protein
MCVYIFKQKKKTMENLFLKTKQIRLKLMVNIYVINQNESWVFRFVYLRPLKPNSVASSSI